ncbi:MAG: glycoside hydrolase family 3 protein [Clostridiales bacterium]|nr:glycoside hydrolase family 3 protein [Candidatus Blautia equi]
MRKKITFILICSILLAFTACGSAKETAEAAENTKIAAEARLKELAGMTPEEIVAQMTIEQKAAQMIQPAIYYLIDEDIQQEVNYGSILSKIVGYGEKDWQETIDEFQRQSLASESGIPMLYGNDDVHGVNFCENAVLFPHNIGLGAANDEELMYQVGLITADEAKICHMPWNFAPVVTQSVDPRWGRTYECYSSDLDLVTKLSTAYTRGLVDGGIVACTKHFFGEGAAKYGTGEKSDNYGSIVERMIDRGDATLTDEEIDELLKVYQAQIDAGAQTIMVSHASLNGVKMHENKKYLMKLKEEMGFEGFLVSDWNSVQNIPDKTYEEQIAAGINAGIDMLMEPDRYDQARRILIDAVKNGDIAEERMDDAVRRILKVKKDAGLFEDPFYETTETKQTSVGSKEYRDVAETLVEESLVLLKNENDLLPLKKGLKVYITGPAADNDQAQCGGWTIDWTSSPERNIEGVTSILEGFKQKAEEYGLTVISNAKGAENADVVINVVGEVPYAEWTGDTEDLELCGRLGLPGNQYAIDEVKALGKPVVTCIVAGRHVILNEEDYNSWDSVVMCYLPGSEGQGVADVLCGAADFHGKLPSPWYSSLDQIGTEECWLEKGYGLTYAEDAGNPGDSDDNSDE